MKAEIHPDYELTVMKCVCGNRWETRSTAGGTVHVDICSACHPFYTGKQKLVDTAGRVERFRKRYEKAEALKAQKTGDAPAETSAAEAPAKAAVEAPAKKAPAKAAKDAPDEKSE